MRNSPKVPAIHLHQSPEKGVLSEFVFSGLCLLVSSVSSTVSGIQEGSSCSVFNVLLIVVGASPMVRWVKNPPANAGDAGEASLIPGSGRFPWSKI